MPGVLLVECAELGHGHDEQLFLDASLVSEIAGELAEGLAADTQDALNFVASARSIALEYKVLDSPAEGPEIVEEAGPGLVHVMSDPLASLEMRTAAACISLNYHVHEAQSVLEQAPPRD